MGTDSRYLISVSRFIAADPQAVFDIVADPARHPEMDGSGSIKAARQHNPARLSQGATFSMDMHLGADYKIKNTVVEFDEPTLIGWRHFNGHIWRYRFTAANSHGQSGTQVTEEWDARPAKRRIGLLLLGFPKRNRAGMTATLERLERLATRPS